MRAIIQRVSEASVAIGGETKSKISKGLLLLLGVEDEDDNEDVEWLSSKIANLRIFNDVDGIMNLSILETGGDVLSISQFTLHAKTKKGNRPSFIKAAKAEKSMPIYESFNVKLAKLLGKKIHTGEFGAMMQVALINDGPVTILIDSKNKE